MDALKHAPVNLDAWIENNKETLLPPINNRSFGKTTGKISW